jgi:4-amino-4-deoxy-L-arabinose transferase-like glycosyltransferase
MEPCNTDPKPPPKLTDRKSSAGLFLILALFALMRLPALLHAPGAQDEQWYGVPGFAVAGSGVPSVPYCRANEQGSVFFGADEMLFAQPPLSFYAQAPFFLTFRSGHAAARMASFFAACVAIVAVYSIGQLVFRDRNISLIAALLYSLSRLLFFPAVTARPDMLCGLFGFLAVLCLIRWNGGRLRWLMMAGACVALGGLSHPFALVFAIQAGVWVIAKRGTLGVRVYRAFVFNGVVAATFALWLPLILQRPDLFRAQFIGNILRPAGPGLLSRFVFPGESFSSEIPQLFDRAHPIQFCMLAAALVLGGLYAWRSRDASFRLLWLLATTSVYLLVICVGVHPIQGFWGYPAGLTILCFAKLLVDGIGFVGEWSQRPGLIFSSAIFAMVVAHMPGAGLRATAAYVLNWNVPDYSVDQFVASTLKSIPEDSTITVGPEFSLEVLVDGRRVILACQNPMCFDSSQWPTDYLLIGRRDFEVNRLDWYRKAGYVMEHVASFGNRDDIFCNYSEVWRLYPPANLQRQGFGE